MHKSDVLALYTVDKCRIKKSGRRSRNRFLLPIPSLCVSQEKQYNVKSDDEEISMQQPARYARREQQKHKN